MNTDGARALMREPITPLSIAERILSIAPESQCKAVIGLKPAADGYHPDPVYLTPSEQRVLAEFVVRAHQGAR